MKRLLQAPNLVLATLWADQLTGVGINASVQRAYASGIAGHIPPDQSLPEVWVEDGLCTLSRARGETSRIPGPAATPKGLRPSPVKPEPPG